MTAVENNIAEKILQVDNLIVRFRTAEGLVQAVNGISYDLHKGETIGIVGESGCGKSVSVLSVMGLLQQPPAEVAGKVMFKDKELFQLPDRQLRKIRGSEIAMVYQDPMTSLNPLLTIGFQLAEPLQVHQGMDLDQAHERSIELLQIAGIPDAKDRLDDYPHEFSGGMRQRVMIAMALSCNPSLLIADEPTTALDVTIQAQIVDLVRRLRDQFGMSLIWITHDLGIVAGIADRVIVMYAGYLVEEALVDDLFDHPLHPYTMALLRSIPTLEGTPGEKLDSIEGIPPDCIELPRGCPFEPRCAFKQEICGLEMPPSTVVISSRKLACWVDTSTNLLRQDVISSAQYQGKVR
jgi:oligopeptide transport system ATP-binding protein